MKVPWASVLALLVIMALAVPASATYTDAIGFRWDTSNPSPTLTRVWANGSVANVDGEYFNNHAIWGNIKKVLVNRDSQKITYGTNNRGDGLDLTGTGENQVMVEIPLFYEYSSYSGSTFTYLVCPTQYNASFNIHPMFNQRGNGTPSTNYYVGAYEMQTEVANGMTTGTSYTNRQPVVSQPIGTMRTYAESNGVGWGLMNIWTWSGIRELLYIETGTLNSQAAWSKSRGVVDIGWHGYWEGKNAGADSADTNTYAINGTGSGTGTDGLTPVVYRSIQDFWGDDWEFIDGQNSYTSGANSIWRNINRTGLNTTGGQTKFQDLLVATDYETSTTTTIADGYQTTIANGSADRLLMIPTAVGGSETTYLSDYFWYPRSTSASTPNILLAGGGWDSAGVAGAGTWHSDSGASHSGASLGARLEFRPPKKYDIQLLIKDYRTLSLVSTSGVNVVWQGPTSSDTGSTMSGVINITASNGDVLVYLTAPGYEPQTAQITVSGADKIETIYLTEVDSVSVVNSPPKSVRFHIQGLWGESLDNVAVTAQAVSTPLGDWTWLANLLGYPTGEIPLNSTIQSGTTDDQGDIAFLMMESTKYNVTAIKTNYIFDSLLIYPHDERYFIVARANGTPWYTGGYDYLKVINISVETAEISDTEAFVNITYMDPIGGISTGSILVIEDNVTSKGDPVILREFEVNSSFQTFSYKVTHTGPDQFSGYIKTNISNSNVGGPVNLTRTFWFKGEAMTIPQIDAKVTFWFACIILIITAMSAGVSHAPQVSFVVCFEAWIFYAIGWFNWFLDFVDNGRTTVLFWLSGATFLSLMWIWTERKRKEKY